MKPTQSFWTDLEASRPEELFDLMRRENISIHLAEDCLDARHLPKIEPIAGSGYFILLRACDSEPISGAETIREMTRKIALLYWEDRLVTIHRSSLKLLETPEIHRAQTSSELVLRIFRAVIDTYWPAVEKIEGEIDTIEHKFFAREFSSKNLARLYRLKRRLLVFKRMALHFRNTVDQFPISVIELKSDYRDLQDRGQALFVFVDELIEDLDSLLGLQLAFASHKTNEVMRVLALFSAFFMPLTFIVGVYGMNFENMPELRSPYGYPLILCVMAMIGGSVGFWFRRKGWLK